METPAFKQFLLSLAFLGTGAFVLSAVFTPPDPFSQLRTLVSPLVLSGSYLFVYKPSATG